MKLGVAEESVTKPSTRSVIFPEELLCIMPLMIGGSVIAYGLVEPCSLDAKSLVIIRYSRYEESPKGMAPLIR